MFFVDLDDAFKLDLSAQVYYMKSEFLWNPNFVGALKTSHFSFTFKILFLGIFIRVIFTRGTQILKQGFQNQF